MISEDPGRDDLRLFQTQMVPDDPHAIWDITLDSFAGLTKPSFLSKLLPAALFFDIILQIQFVFKKMKYELYSIASITWPMGVVCQLGRFSA